MSTLPIKLRIRTYGDPSLRRRAIPVKAVTDRERAVFKEMGELMRLQGGIGLAAPQVGLCKQMILIDIGSGEVMLVNPKIVKRSGSEAFEEGCLSLPGVYVKVKRAKKVTVTGINEENEKVTICAEELFARALQHEIDHLRGRLIIDYASLLRRISLRKKLKNLTRELTDV